MSKHQKKETMVYERAARALTRMVRLEQDEAPMSQFAAAFYELYVDGKLDLEQCEAAFATARLFGDWKHWDQEAARVFAQQFATAHDCFAWRRA